MHTKTVRKVVHAVTGHDGLHRGVALLLAGGRGRVVTESRHRGAVRTRRVAGDRNEVRVHAVLVAVFTQPGDRAFRVDHVVGIRCARAQPVIGIGAHPAERREMVAQRQSLFALVAEDPGAAVNEHEGRPTLRVTGTAVNVHRENAPGAPRKRHVANHRYAFPQRGKRFQQQVPRYALDLVELEFRGDRFGDRRGPPARQPEDEQYGARCQGEIQSQLAGPAVERAEQRKSAGQQQCEADVKQRQVQREESQQPARQDRDRPADRPRRIDDDRRADEGDKQEQPAGHRFRKSRVAAEQ